MIKQLTFVTLVLLFELAILKFSLAKQDLPQYQRGQTRISPSLDVVSGQVVTESGIPVPGATILCTSYNLTDDFSSLSTAQTRPFREIQKTVSGPLGSFKLDDFESEGAHQYFMVTHPLYASSTFRITDRANVTITLRKSVPFRGRIVDADGKPVANADITLWPPPPETAGVDYAIVRNKSDQNGEFQLSIPPNRESYLKIQVGLRFSDFVKCSPEPGGGRQSVYSNGSELRLPRLVPLELNLETNSKRSLVIQSVKHGVRKSDSAQFRIDTRKVNARRFQSLYLREGPNRIWVQPPGGSSYLEAFHEIHVSNQQVPLRKAVDFQQGMLVTGVVQCEESGEPISDAAVAYRPIDPDQIGNEVYVAKYVRTDQRGRFEITVPLIPGRLQVVGEVPGYVTLNARRSGAMPVEIAKQLVREITPNLMDGNNELANQNFGLSRVPVVDGRVVDQDGKPLKNVLVIADRDRAGSFMMTESGDDGSFKFESLLDGARQMHAAIHGTNRLPLPRFFCFDRERGLYCEHTLTHEEAVKEHDLEMGLKPANAVFGVVRDAETNKPVGGVTVSAELGSASGRTITASTTTDDDGRYLLEFIPKRKATQISFRSPSFLLESRELRDVNELVTDLQDVFLKRSIKAPSPQRFLTFAKKETGKLSDVIARYLDEELMKLALVHYAENQTDYAARRRFMTELTQEIGPVVQEFLVADTSDVEKLDVLATMERKYREHSVEHRLPEVANGGLAKKLWIQQIDRPSVFEQYRNSSLKSVDMDWHILLAAKDMQIRSKLLEEMLLKLPGDVSNGLVPNFSSKEEFEIQLDRLEHVLRLGFGEFQDRQFGRIQMTFKSKAEMVLSSLNSLDLNGMVPSRVKRFKEMLRKFGD